MAAFMRAPTSIGSWLRMDSGIVQTHQSALACCGVAGALRSV